MLTYTGSRNLYGEFTRDASSGNLTLGDTLINESIRTICSLRNGSWPWLESLKTVATVASQQTYTIPTSIRKLADIYVTVGSTIYMPEIVYDPNKWKLILAYQMGESDVPRFCYVQDRTVYFAPTPATSANTITFRGRKKVVDLNTADYTTGSVVSIANAGTAVVGTGTTWTNDMEGRVLRITKTSAANGGDGQWYEIATYTSATALSIATPYEGESIAAATAAYTIGQISPIPEQYQMAPVYRATAMFYQARSPELAAPYWRLYDGGKEIGITDVYGGLVGTMLEEVGDLMEGSYIPPFGSQSNIINPNYPQPTASGF